MFGGSAPQVVNLHKGASTRWGPPPVEGELKTADAIIRRLEALTAGFQQCFNENSFEKHWIRDFLSPNFKANYDDQVNLGIDASFAYRRRFKEENPHLVMNVLDVESTLDERRGEATIWQNVELAGRPPGTLRRAFVVTEWELRGGKWRCRKITAMASMPGIGGDKAIF